MEIIILASKFGIVLPSGNRFRKVFVPAIFEEFVNFIV